MRPTTATIRPGSPRHATWLEILGTDTVTIESPVAHWAEVGFPPNSGINRKQFYKLHVPSLTPGQRTRIVDYMSGQFGIDPAEVDRDIDGPHGVPILADDVTVSLDARAML